MKNKFIYSILLLAGSLTLVSCNQAGGGETKVDKYDGYQIENKDAKRATDGISKFSIYAINDFHGAVKEDGSQMGLGYLGSYMKKKTSEPNTLFIDSGDTWQGSLESNYNRGKLITDVFNEAKLSARVSGNHDFDWGTDKYGDNVSRSEFPNLAANVYNFDWSSKTTGETQQSALGKSYATYVLDNGLKIGIIGTIGEEQITSICTQHVEKISFTDDTKCIQNISDFLRVDKKCDVIIAATHASYLQTDSMSLTKTSSVSKKRYVDLVLNAHTHKQETFIQNDVYFAQFGGYGEIIGSIDLYYNFKTNQLVDASTNVKSISSYSVKNELNYTVDSDIANIINEYSKQTKDLGSQVLSTNFSGSFYSSEQLPNLMAEAIYKEAKNQGFNVNFGYSNFGRASHYASSMTYSDLYNIFPFDNTVPIIEVKGKQAANMLRYNNFMYNPDLISNINYNTTYTVACLDYLAFHCDENRNYDYFPSIKVLGYLTKNGETYTYREVLKDYLLSNPEKEFISDDYGCSNPVFARQN